MTGDAPVLLWFRRDLRLSDHPALSWAAASGRPVIAVFILDKAENALGGWIRALERSARRHSSSEQVTEKFSKKKKSKFSNNGNGTQNLQHLRVCTFTRLQ